MKLSLCSATLFLMLSTLNMGYSHAATSQCNQTQEDAHTCAEQTLNQADAELNQTYLTLRQQLNNIQKRQATDVQLAWVKYRKLVCDFESNSTKDKSMHDIVRASCLAKKTQARTDELKAAIAALNK